MQYFLSRILCTSSQKLEHEQYKTRVQTDRRDRSHYHAAFAGGKNRCFLRTESAYSITNDRRRVFKSSSANAS